MNAYPANYPVTFGLALLAGATSLAWWSGADVGWAFQDIRAFHGEFWRLLTSALPHVALWHLAFNLYWLWVFGTLIEASFGPLRTAGLLLFLAGSSAAIAGSFGEDGVGLSGVGYGLFALLWVLGRRDGYYRQAVSGQTTIVFVAWFILCVLLTRSGALNVGNIAHGAGAACGALAGLSITEARRRPVLVVLASAALVLALVAGAVWRPGHNLFARPGTDFAVLGYWNLEAGRDEHAAELLRQAVEADGSQADWWYNLGVAYSRLRRLPAAEEALGRALRLDPDKNGLRKALVDCEAYLGDLNQSQSDHATAVRFYQKALDLDSSQARIWYRLGISNQQLGRAAEARAAYRRAAALDPREELYQQALSSIGPAGNGPGQDK